MATVTRVVLACDVCGAAADVQTCTFGLDGTTYEIDLCPKDRNGLSKVAGGYAPKARTATAPRSQRPSPARRRNAEAGRKKAAKPRGAPPEKGIYVYGILPADIEVAGGMPGVGKHPGPLRAVHRDGLAALVSEVDLAGRLGSPDDMRIHRQILDATVTAVPVLPLRFGTVLASEDAVAQTLLAAHHDEFAEALAQLDGRAEFLVKGRYAIKAAAAERDEDTRALERAMADVSTASVVLEPADEPDAVNVAFLADAGAEREVEQAIEGLAREWDGRIEVQLAGPMAAYDFVESAEPDG